MTLEDFRLRKSIRSYTDEPIDPTIIKSLKAVITHINTHQSGMHFQLVTDSADPFAGFSRSYGMFRNARNYVACVVDTTYAHYMERAGYFGMEVLMRAFTLGLGTCFVSGSYSAKNTDARIRAGEKLLFIIVLGYESVAKPRLMASLMHSLHHRKSGLTPMDFLDTELPWEKICDAYPKLLSGLEAVSYAPSAMNKQPVGILIQREDDPYNPVAKSSKSAKKQQQQSDLQQRYEALLRPSQDCAQATDSHTNGLVLKAYVPAKDPAQLIDLGIAMYSFQAVYPGQWQWGNPATFIPA